MSGRARSIIRAEYGESRNFMTPNVMSYHLLDPNTAAELSSGSGLRDSGPIYGVSIARETPDGTERDTELSKVFHDADEAREYIRELSA